MYITLGVNCLPSLRPKILLSANRIDKHTQGRHDKTIAVHPLQRITDRRTQIGATADGLGDEDFGLRGGR